VGVLINLFKPIYRAQKVHHNTPEERPGDPRAGPAI
jgi:hypothetical protein